MSQELVKKEPNFPTDLTEQQRRLLGTTDGNNANYPSDHGF